MTTGTGHTSAIRASKVIGTTVKDSSGHPVKNVLVHILDGKMDNAHSNANGIYLTQPLPVGTWLVEYSKGERKINKQVEIKQGEELSIDIVL